MAAPFLDVTLIVGLAGVGAVDFVAAVDVDNDWWIDLVVGDRAAETVRVFRNLGLRNDDGADASDRASCADERAAWLGFEDVTYRSGGALRIAADRSRPSGLPMIGSVPWWPYWSVACADLGGDGRPDIIVGAGKGLHVYSAGARGVMVDISGETGVQSGPWTTMLADHEGSIAALALVDYDLDADLDLVMTTTTGDLWACLPDLFDGRAGCVEYPPAYVLENTRAARTSVPRFLPRPRATDLTGQIHGIACMDFTGDSYPDCAVATDFESPTLLVNRGGTGLYETSALSALEPRGPMGVEIGDLDGDARMDVLVSAQDPIYALRSRGDGTFDPVETAYGIAAPTTGGIGWGVRLADLNGDGALDIVQTNGDIIGAGGLLDWYYDIKRVLVLAGSRGSPSFSEPPEARALFTRAARITRPLALADFDRDGDLDIVTASYGPAASDARVTVWRNDLRRASRFVTLRLRDSRGNRDGIGAIVLLHSGSRTRAVPVLSGNSYRACQPPEASFAVEDRIGALDVRWPDGQCRRYPSVAAALDRSPDAAPYAVVKRGVGEVACDEP